VTLPMPGVVGGTSTDHRNLDRLPASYANFYIANNVVLAPIFGHANDSRALETLQRLFNNRRVVGINAGLDDGTIGEETVEPFQLPPGALDAQRRRIDAVRARRDGGAVQAALEAVGSAATGGDNVMGPIGAAVAAGATLGEIGTVLRDSLGRWHFPLW